jgi:hypothetical protein
MTWQEQPERLSERADASDPLARALRASSGEGPSAERLAGIGGGLQQGMLQGAGAPSSLPTPRPSGAALKVLAPLLLLGGVAWLLARAPAAAPAAAPEPRAVAPAAAVAAPAPERAAAPPPPSPAVVPLPAITPTPRSELAARAAPLPRAAAAVQPPDELSLLRAAQAQLASAPALALETLAEHQRHFPQGALAQEREVLAVDALLSLGRFAEARVRADALPLAYPDTPHRRRLLRLFERHGADPIPTTEVP